MELEKAKDQEKEQYEDMCLRIQYMYEQSNSGYLEVLFDSGSFSEFLNRAGNISQITQYDRDMLDEYQATKHTIAEHEKTIKEEKAEIERLRRESEAKQDQVEELVQVTYNQIGEYAADLQDAQSEEAALLHQISQQETEINALLKQAKDEEAAARKAAQEEAARKAAREEAQKAAQEEAAQEQEAEEEESVQESQEPETSQEAEEPASEEPAPDPEPEYEPEESEPAPEPEEPEEETESSSSDSGTYLGNFRLTAYCNCSKCCGQWSGGATASGTTPTPGRTVAMGGIAFGTKLLINGQVYTVEDRGTAYGHVDIYMGSHSEALNFGMQYADVYVVG